MKIKVPCVCTKTKGKARKVLWQGKLFPNLDHLPPKQRLDSKGNPISNPCPYCNGTKRMTKVVPDLSHRMSRWRTEIRSPTGSSTNRFYGVRHCKKCGEEELSHPAGHFLNGLTRKCRGKA